jgi:hypothetical protein
MSSPSHNHSYMEKAVDVSRVSYLRKLDSFICSFKMTTSSLEPLECLLHSIVSRLEVIENKLGVIVRTTRDYDIHQKSIVEMLFSLSWVVMVPPPKTPSSYVNDILGATEFWSNKIRKTFKGIEGKEIHIIFGDCLKVIIQELASYTKEFHPLGLSWNPKGYKTLEEAARSLDSSEIISPSTGPENQVEIPAAGIRGGGMVAYCLNHRSLNLFSKL